VAGLRISFPGCRPALDSGLDFYRQHLKKSQSQAGQAPDVHTRYTRSSSDRDLTVSNTPQRRIRFRKMQRTPGPAIFGPTGPIRRGEAAVTEETNLSVSPWLNAARFGDVLIVDDTPENLRLLEGLLKPVVSRIRLARSGEVALTSAEKQAPDIILLDVRMPAMDGYEVCRRLKANPHTAEIPVIFISALQETGDKLRGFHCGGVDFIVKPFQPEEVVSRVKTHLELALARRAQKADNFRLEQCVAERTGALSEANAHLEARTRQEQLLNELLKLSLAGNHLQEYLGTALYTLNLKLGWHGAQSKNLIFLANRDDVPGNMWLAASHEVNRADRRYCKHLKPGFCHCYRAIQSGVPAFHDLQFTDCDSLSKLSVGGCGRYWVPLRDQDRVLGAMVHFFPPDCPESELDKPFLMQVGAVLALGVSRRDADDRVAHLAFHDELTGLPNRRLFENRLVVELNRSRRHGTRGAILFVDLDHFKDVNDVLGHAVGDELLRAVARRLKRDLRSEDTMARWGGDEFLFILSDVGTTDLEVVQNVLRVADKLRDRVRQPFHIFGKEVTSGASIGIAIYPTEGASAHDLVKRADAAMYQAKQAGRNNTHFFEQFMLVDAERKMDLEKNLRKGLVNREFFLNYQPQTDSHGRLLGIEALVRWLRPDLGLVSPMDFIPVAEETGMISALGSWILHEAAERFSEFLKEHAVDDEVTLAVNMSSRQFHEPSFAENVLSILRETGLPPERLKLEVTETLLMRDLDRTVGLMEELREHGVRFSVDDFGIGYSSLTYLKRLPIDELKIDQSFVRASNQSHKDRAIITTILALAQALDLRAVAEGVETENELDFLKDSGCQCFQGYFFSRPVTWEKMVEFLSRGRVRDDVL
jgi:diguanylate cyclase (GGDEF)-like protein